MNTTNGRVQTQDVEGTVEAVNATGLKIGGAWVNVSQFHPLELPDAGAHVRVKIDAKGYIRELEVVPTVLSQTPAVLSDRDARITRLAVLKAAAGFGASRPDMKSADVQVLAERWLAWIEQA
jgi:hypothetical protein